MGKLNRSRNLSDADDIYAALIAAHEGLSDEESTALNARLILTLFNHIGDADVIGEALEVATLAGQQERHKAL
ncbi:DUF2783 domain-containing protein [Notoacmeibacter sp. MSK16QG-6]|uniref:DUF2783 domain-containing protein n=1 Tax=Notoacmeibacter sp. MSK16QG-6 TaxID=2957982 RepID=UPI00209DF2AD|nr:DUF2783 domain-containing protein [Notoacmeibacter sp. MSK16QG-6]MCP1200304.1 DUF2783 domain-containing protein [Notoacmeibacter sp. MSK16QG-6]